MRKSRNCFKKKRLKIVKKCLGLTLALACAFTPLSTTVFASDTVEVDKAMGDSFKPKVMGRAASGTTPAPKAPSGTVATGVDISYHNGTIDFKKLKKSVDFVIIRCGYGQDMTSQDDKKYETYVKGCRDNNIPYGIYLYSYADTLAKAKSEGQHALRMVKKLSSWNTAPSLPVFYDMEDPVQAKASKSLKGDMAEAFCKPLESAGYKTGVYANTSWWNSYLTDSYFNKTIKWVAQYGSKCTYGKIYQMWQCSSTVAVSGIPGGSDYNYMLSNLFTDRNISKCTVNSIANQNYTGKAVKPSVTVKNGSTTLKKDTDYTVAYSNNTNVGTATVKITGKGTYTGSKSVNFKIVNSAPTASDYKGTYDGKAHSITVTGQKSGTAINYSTDNAKWSTAKPTRTAIGTTKVYYKATGEDSKEYTGPKNITISAKAISSCTFSNVADRTYTGKQMKPSVTVKNESTTLKNGTDYTVSYGANKNTGNATIKITGKGNFNGSKTITFHIKPAKVTISSVKKGSAAKSAVVKWNKVTGATGYQVAYQRRGSSSWSYATVTSTSKTFKGLAVKKYNVKVRAYKTVSGTKYYGAYSNVKKMTAK